MIKNVSGDIAETRYFDEHQHIDKFHSTMVLENIIIPILNRYGDLYNSEILLGFNEFSYYLQWNENEIISQIEYAENINKYINKSHNNINLTSYKQLSINQQYFSVSNYDEVISVDKGNIEVIMDHDCKKKLETGDTVFIPKGIHYGLAATNEVKIAFHLSGNIVNEKSKIIS